MVVHPIERAEEMLRFYRDFTHAAPDELTVYAAITSAPDGQPVAAMVACYHGPFEEGERVLAPLRAFGPPLVDLIRPMSYLELVHILDAGAPDGRRYYEKGNSLPELTDEAIATIADFGAMRTSPFSQALIQHIHGVAARVDPAATAAHTLRGEQYVLGMIAAWDDGDDKTHIAWSRAFWKETRPFAKEGVYVNFMNDDSAERVRAAYGSNYARLAAIKSKYDPENVFRLNQNIAPAAK